MMAPNVGDVVFVAVHDEYDNSNTVAPAIVTHVFNENDGDPRWWDAAKDKGIVEATVFTRGGGVTNGVYGKSEQVTIDDGEGGTLTYPVGYATTPDGHGDVTADPATPTPTPVASVSPATQTTNATATTGGLSDADIQRLAAAIRADEGSGTPTQTVGDGSDVASPTGGNVTSDAGTTGTVAP